MPARTRSLLAAAAAFLLVGCLLWGPHPARAGEPPDVKKIVEELVTDYVAKSGNKVVGLGSWIKGNRYRNPLLFPGDPSDHDMTLILDSKDPGELKRAWKRFQKFMKNGLEEKLHGLPPEDVQRVLDSVNIYPPDQLTADIFDQADAVAKYRRLGGKPNLGRESVEGIWGKGKKPFVQAYSNQAGRTFYRDSKGVVRKGFTDLDNMIQGFGRFTTYNTAHLSSQFAEKASEALLQNKPALVLKDLKRLDQYLRKSKSMAGLSGASLTNPEIESALKNYQRILHDTLAQEAAKAKKLGRAFDPEIPGFLRKVREKWLSQNRGLVEKGLQYAKLEAAYCRQVAAGTDEAARFLARLKGNRLRRFLALVRKGVDQSKRLGGAGMKLAGKVPWGKVLKAAAALGAAMDAYSVYDAYRKQGLEAALRQANLSAILTVFPSAAVSEFILEYAKDRGYDLVTRYQDCQDLVSGIYSVKGRERVGRGLSLEKLARNCYQQSQVVALLRHHARQAADKRLAHASAADRQSAQAVALRLTEKCQGPILEAWHRQRLELLGRLLAQKIKLDFRMSRLNLTLQLPFKKGKGKKVHLKAILHPAGGRRAIWQIIRAMNARLKDLGGTKRIGKLWVRELYLWRLRRLAPGAPGPFQVVQRKENLLLPQSTRPNFMGYRLPVEFYAAKGGRYQLVLDYTLWVRPDRDAELAPEVIQYYRQLLGRYDFKLPLEFDLGTPGVVIEGPARVALGASARLRARPVRVQYLPSGSRLRLEWWDAGGRRLGAGALLNLAPRSRPGSQVVQVRMLEVGGKPPQELAVAAWRVQFVKEAATQHKPALPRKTKKLPCRKYSLLATFKGASHSPSHLLKKEKNLPPVAKHQVRLPGPGRLSITMTTWGRHQMSSHVYGFCRGRARAILRGAGFKNAWVAGGRYFPGVTNKGSNSYSWKVKQAGVVTISVRPENCPAGYDRKSKKVRCVCYGSKHKGYLNLPTHYELKVKFMPACK